MSFLGLTLLFKIAVTLFLLAPLMLGPARRLGPAFSLEAAHPLIFRLYGMAIAALLVGYGFGFAAAQNGAFPWGPVVMGIVSNGGAALILAAGARGGASSPAILAAMAIFGGIGVSLTLAAIFPQWAMTPLF